MSSELKKQVSALRKQHIDNQPLHHGRPSLFLTTKEAAAVDVQTIFEAAKAGLETLQQYDPRFEQFHNNILHPSSVELQRELKSKDENKVLDEQLQSLMNLLALFAAEQPCHLVLEYLIRRFRVHELNTHILIRTMLVVHDTKVIN
jgi:U3 small nucleolar RNA-associated protein 10